MLSGETSVGDHPIKVIEAMNKIVEQAETFEGIYYKETVPSYNQERFITDSICYNSCRLAHRVGARAIVTMTHSGYTAFKISSQRPKATVYVFTSNRSVMTKLNLVWGVKCFYYNKMVSTDHTIADIKYILRKAGELKDGDLVINIASMPISEQGMSNMVKLSYVK
jgi:pyruvate kinase